MNIDPQSNHKKLRLVGKIKQAHGLRGEVYVLIFSGDISWKNKLNQIFLKKTEDIFDPRKVLQLKPFKQGFLAKLESVTDRNQSEELVGLEVWISSEILVSEGDETPYLIQIENFKVNDARKGHLGQISGFSSNGIQDLLIVSSGDQPSIQYEIPFVDQFVLKIDYDQQILWMDLPEGLLEINSVVQVQDDNHAEIKS